MRITLLWNNTRISYFRNCANEIKNDFLAKYFPLKVNVLVAGEILFL